MKTKGSFKKLSDLCHIIYNIINKNKLHMFYISYNKTVLIIQKAITNFTIK